MRWKAAAAWYAARPKREKLILAFAGLALVWALTDALWLSPATRAYQSQFSALSQKQAELDQLETQRAALKESLRVREAELRRDTDNARQQLADITDQLAEFEKALVPARQMPDFLRSLLPGAGVDIVTLRTLAPTPLILRGAARDGKTSAASAPAANIYKHGIEITLAGNYDALLAYLSRLEKSPQKVLWGRLELKVEKHPRNELVLVLYTLSLDPSWLVV
jgi:MSHA biogenesis protein MshJ